MPKIQTYKDQKREASNMLIYSKEELRKFEVEVEKYMIEKEVTLFGTTKNVKYLSTLGFEKFFFDHGATTKDFSIIDIPKFKLLQDKFEQYNDWIRRKEFAIRMSDQNYEKMIEGLADKFGVGEDLNTF